MSTPYWSMVEVEPNKWWAVDAYTGTAFAVSPQAGERMWSSNGLRAMSLAEALEANGEKGEVEAFVDLDFAGVTTRYLCAEQGIAEHLRGLYAGAAPPLRRSPDVLVKIGPSADLDRLHRSIGVPREGVHVREVASHEWSRGSKELPIIPPVQSAPFLGRFCAVHAALVSTSAGGFLVCGAQRTGKTSAAMLATQTGVGTPLADEMVLLDTGGSAYGVPLPVRERKDDGRDVSPLPRPGSRYKVVTVGAVILLERAQDDPTWDKVERMTERLRLMVPHIRVLDGPLGRATECILRMLREADVWLWRLRPWPALHDDLKHGLRTILESKDGD